MANIKVSEMTEAISFDNGDYTMIVQANQNKKIARENILGDIEGDISTINNDISTINTNIGNLSNLTTEDKTSVVNSINELKNAEIYSTNEVKTNKIWINGKPIYRKVIETGTIANTSKDVAHGISNLGIVVSVCGIAVTSSNAYFTIPRIVTSATNQQIGLSVNNVNITIDAGSVASFANSFVVIEYTKTTD